MGNKVGGAMTHTLVLPLANAQPDAASRSGVEMVSILEITLSIGMLIVAALVPFLSVYAAQQLVRQDAKRTAAREVFLRVHKDIQDFRVAFLTHFKNIARSPDVQKSARELQEMVTALNADCLVLGLIFDKQADPLGRRVQQLGRTAQLLFSDSPPPTFKKCQEGLNRDIQAISQEMKPLWDSLK